MDQAQWDLVVTRYRDGEWRSRIFADLVLQEVRRLARSPVVLDIGCGAGFDGSARLQQEIVRASAHAIGVEPDPETNVAPIFAEVHRCSIEHANIRPNSIDIAYAVMVVEHVRQPKLFFDTLARVMKDGGVFWAFTVDVRHWSSWISLAMERLNLKEVYFQHRQDRYANFPVCYRLNSPRQVLTYSAPYFDVQFVNLARIGSEDSSIPRFLRPCNHFVDHVLARLHAPGANFAFRAVRKVRR